MNRVILLGNLGGDPELRETAAGVPVLSLRMATTVTYLDRDKVRKEQTEWHRVVLFGGEAEDLARSLRKGQKVLVEGSIRYSSYVNDKGAEIATTEIHAREITIPGDRVMPEQRQSNYQRSAR